MCEVLGVFRRGDEVAQGLALKKNKTLFLFFLSPPDVVLCRSHFEFVGEHT